MKNLSIAIHHVENVHKDSYSRRWIEYLKNTDIKAVILDFRQADIINQVKGCDGVMWHWIHMPDEKQAAPKILDAIEEGLGTSVFPNRETRWHYDEKVSQHYFLESIDAPKIRSWVFWDKEEALEFTKTAKFPLVFKLSVGAGSSNVLKLDQYKEAEKLIDRLFDTGLEPYTFNEFEKKDTVWYPDLYQRIKDSINYLIKRRYPAPPFNIKKHWYYLKQKNYVYFQEYIPDNDFDIRITTIGRRAFGFIRYNRKDDFRASGSGDIHYHLDKIPLEAVKLALDISIQNNFQSMAYDFLMDTNNQPVINEISYCYQNLAVYNCPGHWDVDMVWHEGHVWPENAIIEDFIQLIKSRL